MLDKKEEEIINKVMQRENLRTTSNLNIKYLNASYIKQGNFTICILENLGEFVTAGVTKRNPIDINQEEVGKSRALSNAIKNLFK